MYNVKTTAGNTLVNIPDRHIDRDATSLALLGFNATSYGLDHAENFVHLLEHFANDIPPENPIKGQLWFDTGSNAMKMYSNGKWSTLSGTPSTSDDPTEGGIAGIYHCPMAGTSVAIIFAGGKIVAVVASRDIDQSLIPEIVTIDGEDYAFRSVYALGLQGGVNLADNNDENNPDDFVFAGRVPLAEQAHFTGGGVDDAQVSGWAYLDVGPGKSVGLMISCGQVVAAVSSGYVLSGDLPNSFTVYVKKDRDTGATGSVLTGNYKTLDANYNAVTCQVKSRFPPQQYKQWTVATNGSPTFDPAKTINDVALFPGITMAGTVNANGGISQIIYGLIASQTSATGTAIATATEELRVWVDEKSATAQKVTTIESAFKSATGDSSVATAIQTLYTKASDTSAISTAITSLKTDFTTALGSTSFATALTALKNTSDAAQAASSKATELSSAFSNQFGGTTVAKAMENLYTVATAKGEALAGYSLNLDVNGYVIGMEALNGGAKNNSFKVTTSKFIIGDNNIDFIPFEVKDGVVYIKNAAIENLTIGIDKITPGASAAFKFTAPDAYIGGRGNEITIIETPYFAIGDSVSGSAVAFICFFQDGKFAQDASQDIRVYIDLGDGVWVLQREHLQQGFVVAKGNIVYGIPVMFPITFQSTLPCRVKVTSACSNMPGQSNNFNFSYSRNIELHVFKTAR